MDLQKYKNHLFQNIKNKLTEWIFLKEETTVSNDEVYHFLHSIKGTSGTLQLNDLMQISQELLNQLEPDSEKNGGKLN